MSNYNDTAAYAAQQAAMAAQQAAQWEAQQRAYADQQRAYEQQQAQARQMAEQQARDALALNDQYQRNQQNEWAARQSVPTRPASPSNHRPGTLFVIGLAIALYFMAGKLPVVKSSGLAIFLVAAGVVGFLPEWLRGLLDLGVLVAGGAAWYFLSR